ncbi:MAG TPA: hypothetical protein VJS12_03760 [Steroidobacteraceae bacterium]|nr:hypothetical protein [Steroidobacteraceae bacterium]
MRRSTCTVLLALSCAANATDRPYSPRRLDNGQPDMQGVWVASNATPLQRPAGFDSLVIDTAQAAKVLAALDARAEDRNTPTEPTEYFDPLNIEPIRGQLRSSLIVDPPNGLIPGNDLYKLHFAQAAKDALNAMDGPEQRPSPERCLGSQTTQPPILSIRSGVNLHQIVQTDDSFVFTSEFVNTARIVRLSSKRMPPAVTSWLGDSIGRWEGDSLVVETRGFTPTDHFRGGLAGSFLVSPRTVVTERFIRVADDRIDYTFTVEDPTYYTQPWTGESHFMRRQEQIFEYACHEANYSLIHILEGARERERRAQQ